MLRVVYGRSDREHVMSNILEAHDVKLKYGEVVAVKNIDLTIPKNKAVALIGPNGAGKTTLLKGLSGVKQTAGGRIIFAGRDITGTPSHQLARMGIAMIPEGRLPFASMTVIENLMLPVYSMGHNKDETKTLLDTVYGLFPRLKERRWQKAGSLSGGEQQMMVIARALMMKPKILLIDEPSLGLAPIIVEQIYEVMPTLLRSGLSILLVEQSIELALSVCSYISVIKEGVIVHSDEACRITPSKLAEYYLR